MYGLNSEEIGTGIGVRRAAWLVSELPRGSQLWKAVGGAMAVTDEWEMQTAIEYAIRAHSWSGADPKSRGPQPEPMPYPQLRAEFGDKKVKQAESAEDYTTRRAAERKSKLEELRARREG